jgi:hypothetical protein
VTEKSLFWTTDGTGDGPADGYTATQFYDFVRRLLLGDETAQGVLNDVLNELAVSGSTSPLSVASGCAIVYGFFYENTAALNLSVTTPVVDTTGGRVNLKVDWTAQTVRAVVQLNTDGTAAIPSLVQTAGSEWNISLATFTITTGGAITLTDARQFCQFSDYVTQDSLSDVDALSVIGRATNSAGQSDAIAAGTDGYVLRRSGNTIGFGQVAEAGLADLAVTLGKIASDSVDDTKAGNRVPQFYRRQGGSASDWDSAGSTTYTPGAVRMQGGAVSVTISNGNSSGTASVTFPTAFSAKPIILLTNTNSDSVMYTDGAESITSSGFTVRVTRNTTSGDKTLTVYWVAVGTE